MHSQLQYKETSMLLHFPVLLTKSSKVQFISSAMKGKKMAAAAALIVLFLASALGGWTNSIHPNDFETRLAPNIDDDLALLFYCIPFVPCVWSVSNDDLLCMVWFIWSSRYRGQNMRDTDWDRLWRWQSLLSWLRRQGIQERLLQPDGGKFLELRVHLGTRAAMLWVREESAHKC
jgi:hypothetical protein